MNGLERNYIYFFESVGNGLERKFVVYLRSSTFWSLLLLFGSAINGLERKSREDMYRRVIVWILSNSSCVWMDLTISTIDALIDDLSDEYRYCSDLCSTL